MQTATVGKTKCIAQLKPKLNRAHGRVLNQMVRIMKITAIILLTACLQVSANSHSQTVTLSEKDAPLEKIFQAIEQQTEFVFFFDHSLLKKAKAVTIQVKTMALKDALDICFKDQLLTYSIVGKNIVIDLKNDLPARKPNVIQALDLIDIKGRVVNEENDPVAGVSVMIKGTRMGTYTDGDGEFTLNKVPHDAVLVLTAVNIQPIETNVAGRRTLDLKVKGKTGKLDEVQVIAYGKTSQRLNTGNVHTVKGSDIAKQPVNNPLLALQGRVPGLFITQSTGIPGSAITVNIQGQNSLSNGSDPLYVIDGVPYISQMLMGLAYIQGISSGYGAKGTGNPMSYINPMDIESIDILKDADATSIYGSRAAAGAILITTKKGRAGKTVVDLNLQGGWGKVGRFIDLLNTKQYLEMRYEAFKNDGSLPGNGDYDLNGTWDTTRYTDWQKVLIGGTAQYTDANISISGGSGTTTFLASGGYHRETTVFPGELSDQKASVHLNINHSSLNQRFHIQVDGKYLVDNNRLINTDLTTQATQLAPNAPMLHNPDGSLNWAQNSTGKSTWRNPLVFLESTYKGQVHNLIGNALLSYQVFPGLYIKTNIGYLYLQRGELTMIPVASRAPENRPTARRSSEFNNDLIRSWNIEPQLTYKKNIFKGNFEVLLGGTFLKNQSDQQKIRASGFNSDQLMQNIGSATLLETSSTVASIYRYNGLFTRLNYSWQNKYILNLNARRDGSSRFGSENLFHNFGSISGAWIFSSEQFIQKHLPLISFGKLRLSYGTTGNDQILDYRFLNLYFSRSRAVPYQGVLGLFTNGFPNPHLQWEKTSKLQAGIDIGLWSDKTLLNVTYFRNRSSNQLQDYALPIITGNTGLTLNYPATIQNSGWEIMLTTTNIKKKSFAWNSSINLTFPKNKLVTYKDIENSSAATIYVVGKPFTIVKLYRSLGVDPTTGLFIFQDKGGNPISSPDQTDQTVLVNSAPKFYGGFQNSISYKGISIDFLFQFVKKTGTDYRKGWLPGVFESDATFGTAIGNQPVSVLDRWQKPGDNNKSFQQFSTTYPSTIFTPYINSFFSDLHYFDASYIRLKNLSISWQIPDSWRRRVHLQNIRLFTQAQNLLTFTTQKYIGFDPETENTSSLPPLKVWTFGLQVTL